MRGPCRPSPSCQSGTIRASKPVNPRQRILLDCDPGIDDAFALLCAVKYTNLAVVTSVSGNVSIDKTTRNARYILELAGRPDIPVHQGASQPLVVPTAAADDIHGASGLGELDLPQAQAPTSNTSACDAIIDFCADGDAVVIATGPLTNIAHALQHDPTLPSRIRHLYWMGGSTTVGNVTELAEFNAWADPHAVDITVRSGIDLTMFGLNLTHQVRLGRSEASQLQAANSPTSTTLGQLLTYYHDHGISRNDPLGQPVHDTCAVLGFSHPELFTTVRSNIVAHTTLNERRGMTETTPQSTTSASATHRVAVEARAEAVVTLVMAAAIDPRPDK